MPYTRQPSDPDAPSAVHAAHPSVTDVATVFAGGVAGCAVRAAVEVALPAGRGFPVGTLMVNLLGAMLLGVLLEVLLIAGDDSGVRRRLRLLLGTGGLGGFTTYSSFAVETVDLLRAGSIGTAVGYTAATLFGGVLLAWSGISAAQRLRGAR
ncbi:fluoride efflux transporter FluC [Cumulibacter manganitolerans]|uniref:fluoride efflux transporter FluC n=1 Tax=Cumulibacter manganitolerans TaxID=1884992 RepID=UPI001885C366|nr:CrcB family protein [Cumulibacter manganitolerans]